MKDGGPADFGLIRVYDPGTEKAWIKPREYVEFEKDVSEMISRARKHLEEMLELAEKCPPPKEQNLVPAGRGDIIQGAVIWYECDEYNIIDWPQGWFWKIVVEVDRPRDPHKAFTAEDGCRYGLDGAFVEVEADAMLKAREQQ